MNNDQLLKKYYNIKNEYMNLKFIMKGGNGNDIKIMQFNMLANGLMDSFLTADTMKIFFPDLKRDLPKKQEIFKKLNYNIKQIFDKQNANKPVNELEVIFKTPSVTEETKATEQKKPEAETKEELKSGEKTEEKKLLSEKKSTAITYNEVKLSAYENCISKGVKKDSTLGSRIKNISNDLWKMIQTHILENEIKFPDIKEDENKCIATTKTEIEQIIPILAKLFLSSYTTYIKEINTFRSPDEFIRSKIKEFLELRFKIFKIMVINYDPDIICLEEDDYDYYFNNDVYFRDTYGFSRCKKKDSNARKLTVGRTGSPWLKNLHDEFITQRVTDDGVTIMFKKSVFNDLNPEVNNRVVQKGSPHILKKLGKKYTLDIFYVLATHIESGREDYNKEETRMSDIEYIFDQEPKLKSCEITSNTNSNVNLIICMDGNTPFLNKNLFEKYYSEKSVAEGGKSGNFVPSNIEIDCSVIAKNSAMYKLMNDLKMTQNNVAVSKPTKMYSVNRFRGPDSNQIAKIFEYEYHCIDHVFYKGSRYDLEKVDLPVMKNTDDDYENLLPNFDFTKLSELDRTSTLEKYLKESWGDFKHINPKNFVSISDHLPVFVTLRKRD